MNEEKLNKNIAMWSNLKSGNEYRSGNFSVCEIWKKYQCDKFFNVDTLLNATDMPFKFFRKITNDCVENWRPEVHRHQAHRETGGNQLRLHFVSNNT